MAVVDLLELAAATPPRTPWVGLDLGEKTIGVAVSDLTRTVASPLALIRRRKFTEEAAELDALMAGRGAGAVVGRGGQFVAVGPGMAGFEPPVLLGGDA